MNTKEITSVILDEVWTDRTPQPVKNDPHKMLGKLARQINNLGPGKERDAKLARFSKLLKQHYEGEKK